MTVEFKRGTKIACQKYCTDRPVPDNQQVDVPVFRVIKLGWGETVFYF